MVTYTCRYSSGHLIPIIQLCQDKLGIELSTRISRCWKNHDTSIGAAAVGKKARLRDAATLNSKEIKLLAIAIIKLHLSEGIS